MYIRRHDLRNVFSKNKAEEIGFDVWRYFVIPPFYDRLDLKNARKPRIIIGGRGCGKTMLLRYLSHQSAFSPDLDIIPTEEISHIGLYWRADTQFCNAMLKRDIHEDTWNSAFNHFAALMLGMEVLNSLKSISTSKFLLHDKIHMEGIDFCRLQIYDKNIPSSAGDLYLYLENRLWEFEFWVNDVRKRKEPEFLPGPKFVKAIISIVQTQIAALRKSNFYVYLDEYENLTDYQKRIINTWLKHSEVPLIFNLAMKKNAFDIRETLGSESLSDIHDFRQHDLDEYIVNNNFQVFAAEILFLQLSELDIKDIPVNIAILRDPSKMAIRREKDYIDKILTAAQKLLPDASRGELARNVFGDNALVAKLRDRMKKALDYRKSKIDPMSFIKEGVPEASIVAPALIYRDRLKPEEISNEMDWLIIGKKNRFTGPTNWIHNNFVGCLLQLYAPYSRTCPFYAGFKTFCQLSRGNIRHFLELCHKSIYQSIDPDNNLKLPVDSIIQAEAARQASAAFLKEIKSFGRLGEQLYTFVLRLGSLFVLSNKRSTQSEPEQSHFSIRKGARELTEKEYNFLREAVKWSVLLEHIDTKKKTESQPEIVEYILNPIYTPYFHISYRKKRKMELSSDDAICLIKGTLDEFESLMRRFYRMWHIENIEETLNLFSFLDSERNNADSNAGK